jgi:hypothetical protein
MEHAINIQSLEFISISHLDPGIAGRKTQPLAQEEKPQLCSLF